MLDDPALGVPWYGRRPVGRRALLALSLAVVCLFFAPPARADLGPRPHEEAPPAATHAANDAEKPEAHADKPRADETPPAEASESEPLLDDEGNPIEKDPDFDGAIDEAEERELSVPGIDKEKFAEVLRKLVAKAREKIMPKLEAKVERSTEKGMNRIATGLGIFSLCGVFLLLLPLYYKKKYPGQLATLFKYSALAAGTFFVAVNLFAVLLMGMKAVQGTVAHQTNPKIAIVTAALDTLDDKADQMVELGPQVIKPTLDQLASGDTDDPMPVALVDNVARFAKGAKDMAPTFKKVATFLKDVSFLTEYVPMILTLVTVALFILGARPLIKEILEVPARAASGERDVGKVVLKSVMRRVFRELIVTIILAGMLLVLTLVAGVAMSLAVRPAVEAFIDYLLATVMYVQQPNASATVLLVSLVGCIVFIVLNVAAVIVGSALFLGKMQKVLQSMFHDGVKPAEHRRWWTWGVPSVLAVFAIPVVFVAIAYPLVDGPVKRAFSDSGAITNWSSFLLSGPFFFIFGFIVMFWAARGMKALRFILKYPPLAKAPALPDAALAVAAGATNGAPVIMPISPVSFRPPPAPRDIMDAAKDFDDGAATVLVPKNPVPNIPTQTLPDPKFTHEGERFALGYLDDSFGIWYLHQRRAPVELFPRTAEGWASAWGSFVKMEPRASEVGHAE
jgi:hypothetical protein